MRIRNMTERSTWITAWGLTRKHPKVWWPGCHRPGLVGGCKGGTTDAMRLSGVAPALQWAGSVGPITKQLRPGHFFIPILLRV